MSGSGSTAAGFMRYLVDEPSRLRVRLRRNDRAELEEQTEVVARGPVFGDQTIGDPEDVDVLHRVGLAECGLWNQLRAFYSDPARRHLPGRSFWNGSKRPAHSHATYNFVVF